MIKAITSNIEYKVMSIDAKGEYPPVNVAEVVTSNSPKRLEAYNNPIAVETRLGFFIAMNTFKNHDIRRV